MASGAVISGAACSSTSIGTAWIEEGVTALVVVAGPPTAGGVTSLAADAGPSTTGGCAWSGPLAFVFDATRPGSSGTAGSGRTGMTGGETAGTIDDSLLIGGESSGGIGGSALAITTSPGAAVDAEAGRLACGG